MGLQKKGNSIIRLATLLVCFMLLATSCVKGETSREQMVLLNAAMREMGYEQTTETSYEKQTGAVEIELLFDFDNEVCKKNGYTFDIENSFSQVDGDWYIDCEKLSEITNHSIVGPKDDPNAEPVEFVPHEWTERFAPLIAHAGGALRTSSGEEVVYTNSYEALVQSYDLGFRVIEFDFEVTTDGQLAAVHYSGDMPIFDENGRLSITADEFLAFGTQLGYTTMLVGNILDEMLVNTDLFLVTDTKLAGSNCKVPFEVIYAEAVKRDPALLDRIIPQIYNIAMYDAVMEIYAFPNIIFTLYNTAETNSVVVDFAYNKENIKVLTTWGIPERQTRIDAGLVELAGTADLLVYAHTLNDYEDIGRLFYEGVYGLYTDSLTPADIERYRAH